MFGKSKSFASSKNKISNLYYVEVVYPKLAFRYLDSLLFFAERIVRNP
jgi:hypothetical protein